MSQCFRAWLKIGQDVASSPKHIFGRGCVASDFDLFGIRHLGGFGVSSFETNLI